MGLSDCDRPPKAGVCAVIFHDCFSDKIEVDIGFSKVLLLKSNAVPNIAVPPPTTGPPPQQLHLLPATQLHSEVRLQIT